MELRSSQVTQCRMPLTDYVRRQLEEAFGPENRWFCSEHYCCEVNEPDLLLEYYIKHGGAAHFRSKQQRNFQQTES